MDAKGLCRFCRFGFVLAIAATVASSVSAQSRPRFVLHVSSVVREGLVIDVRAESKTVRYELEWTEGGDSCYMPEAGKNYEATLAPDPDFLYVYGVTHNAVAFKIDSQVERAHGKMR